MPRLQPSVTRIYLAEYPGDIAGLATILGQSSLDITRIYANPNSRHGW
jgi:hypothetical protein